MQYQMNPVNDFYFRNSQLQHNYGQQMLPFPPQQPQVPQVNCRFVTNVEEARAAMIDPLSYNLFLDTNSGRIYLKKLGNNGQSDFLSYTVEEKRQDGADPLSEINARLSNIENFLGGMKNESVSVNAGTRQPDGDASATVAEQNEPNGTAESAGVPKMAGNDFWKKRK